MVSGGGGASPAKGGEALIKGKAVRIVRRVQEGMVGSPLRRRKS